MLCGLRDRTNQAALYWELLICRLSSGACRRTAPEWSASTLGRYVPVRE
jgi:hypothetical protein